MGICKRGHFSKRDSCNACIKCKLITQQEWRKKNPLKVKEYEFRYRVKEKERKKIYRAKNRHKLNAYQRIRNLSTKTHIPKWADKNLINDIYMEARYNGLHVDHIIPLKNNVVCGLHWEGNLQLLTKAENDRKGNKLGS